MASGPGRATAGGTAVPFAEPGCPKVQLRPARRWSMNGWLPGAPIGGLAPRRTLDMMKSAPVACTAFVAWCFLALCLWSGTAAAQDPVQDALKGCQSELHTSCSALTPADRPLVSRPRAHEDKLSSHSAAALTRSGYRSPYSAPHLPHTP